MPDLLPVVSVIMPLKDMPIAFVERAVCSAVEQDYAGLLEVIVWNDGSRHRAYRAELDQLARFADRRDRPLQVWHSRRNRGISAARNAACREANGDWLIWLDGDDELPPDAVSHLVAVAARRPATRLVLGQCRAVLPGGAEGHRNDTFVAKWRSTKGLPEDPLMSAVFAVHGALVHRQTFRAVGGFDEAMSHGELTDWFLRTMAELPGSAVAVTDRATYRYHKRPDSHSAERTVLEEKRVQALQRYAVNVGAWPARSFRFGGRCATTGARLYELLTTEGCPVVAAEVGLATQPWTASHPTPPAMIDTSGPSWPYTGCLVPAR